MNEKKKKNITLNDLAGMVKRGFDNVDKGFDENVKEHKTMMQKLEGLGV
jgi:hypothetical protein